MAWTRGVSAAVRMRSRADFARQSGADGKRRAPALGRDSGDYSRSSRDSYDDYRRGRCPDEPHPRAALITYAQYNIYGIYYIYTMYIC